MNIIVGILGAWIIFDGIVSIILYRDQTLEEHLIRIARACVGSALVLISL